MPSPAFQSVTAGIALLTLPMLAVGITAYSHTHRHLAVASADSGPNNPIGPSVGAGFTPRVLRDDPELRTKLDALRELPLGACPVRPIQIIAPPSAIERTVNAAPVEVAPGVPRFTLTSIIHGAAGTHATINGKLRKEGDTVYPGWTVKSIDPTTGQAVIAGPDDQVIECRLNKTR